jgi:hypothetical protein
MPLINQTERSLRMDHNNNKDSPKWDLNPRPKVSVARSPSSSSSSSFHNWLASQHKSRWTIKQNEIYAVRFGHILETGDAAELLTLSPRNRHHALAALAALSKFSGRYDRFLQIRQNYNLKWSSGNDSLRALQRFFDPEMTLDSMLQRIREMIRVLPTAMAAIIRFACLIGLRPAEVVECVRLLNTQPRDLQSLPYYNEERQTLEHFRFPSIFLRQTKKAYLSFITLDNLQPIVNLGCKTPPTWNAIRLTCRRRGINMDMRFCRKVFSSWLRQSEIMPEVVDMLQGRVSPNILTRHYLVPQDGLKDQVLEALEKLKREIEQ